MYESQNTPEEMAAAHYSILFKWSSIGDETWCFHFRQKINGCPRAILEELKLYKSGTALKVYQLPYITMIRNFSEPLKTINWITDREVCFFHNPEIMRSGKYK